jgi:hypothetical protein
MKKIMFLFIILFFLKSIYAIENRFGWSIGDWGISYDFINKKQIQQFNMLRFNWLIENKFGLGFTLFEIQNSDEDVVSYSIELFGNFSFRTTSAKNRKMRSILQDL